eukprot:3594094-Pyramimonas_sp.AAC.1
MRLGISRVRPEFRMPAESASQRQSNQNCPRSARARKEKGVRKELDNDFPESEKNFEYQG